MEIIRLMLLILSAASSLYCLPSRTLNDRSTELAWQAWLLVDDQNQHRQQNEPSPDGILRRRITPKSVFIAPTFSPESLPACAEGYRPDSMGRCIKIIKLDEAAHLDFLLQRLNEKYGGFEEEEGDEDGSQDEDEDATKGPFQLNIPLGEMENNFHDEDIAIIVAPTNNAQVDKADKVKRTQESTDADHSSSLLLDVLGLPHDKQATETTTQEAATTSTILPTTIITTEEVPATSWKPTETQTPQTSTLPPQTNETPTSTINPPQTSTESLETTPTTIAETPTTPQAIERETTTQIPQPKPEKLVDVKETKPETESESESESESIVDSLHALFYLEPKNSTATEPVVNAGSVPVAVDQNNNNNNHNINVNNNNEQLAAASSAALEGESSSSYVKFPDDKEYHSKDYIRFPLQSESVYNHRNRDKHMSFWRTGPLSGNSRAGQSLSHRDDAPSNSEAIYRQLQSGELSYLFGNTRSRRNR